MSGNGMEQGQGVTLVVSGMSCGSCVRHVEEALRRVVGVESVAVDLRGGWAEVRGAADADALVTAVEGAGYQAVPVQGAA